MLRRVLVTGASSGFGRATAVRLAGLDFEVLGLVRDDSGRAELQEAAEQGGVPVKVLIADLSDADQRRDLASGLDLWALVNNAGYMNAGMLRDVPIDDARRQLEAMVLAPMDLVCQALPAMVARGHGRIVHITSSAVHTSTPLTGWYSANKAALRELTDSLRIEVAPLGVDVIDIEPGGYRTGIWSGAAADLVGRRRQSARPDLYDRVLAKMDAGYDLMGAADQVAGAVAEVLTTGRPPRHVRLGRGANALRLADVAVPDRVWDLAVRKLSRIG